MNNPDNEQRQVDLLANIMDGIELSLMCVVLSLHDKGLLDKDVVAERLREVAQAMIDSPDVDTERKDSTTFPMKRLAAALQKSQVVKTDGGQNGE